jgi:hypothetical protein
MTHDVFISFSSKDARMANRVSAALQERDISYWIAARDIVAGDMFDEAILDGIKSAGSCS